MYLYTREGLGECKSTSKWARLGPGTDPIGAEKELCPLLRDAMTGRFLEWLDYVTRTGNPRDRLSAFRKFREEDCYKDYLERCRQFSPVPAPRPVPSPSPSLPPGPPPSPPPSQRTFVCWNRCRREALRCPGGRRSEECQRVFRDCMRNCEGVLA
jgi:hypothetical protein